MKAVLLLNFGEPASADPALATAYLERIFLANARLDPATDPGAVRRRARDLADRRTPDLVAEYEAIGGSPLNAQAAAQAASLARHVDADGRDAMVLAAMQFTDPHIPDALAAARDAGATALVALPVYPVCGPSTTVAALAAVRTGLDAMGWDVPVAEIAGWHAHPAYTRLRARGVREFAARHGLDLTDPDTRLVFSAHGTPVAYLRDGSRYDRYVEDHCRRLAADLGVDRWIMGYQNHANRPGIEWTEPEIGRALEDAHAGRVVVVPISFMQEQSETLFELDHELRHIAHGLGLEFHRAPVPHDDPAFTHLLADLVRPFLQGDGEPDPLDPCRCRPGARCVAG